MLTFLKRVAGSYRGDSGVGFSDGGRGARKDREEERKEAKLRIRTRKPDNGQNFHRINSLHHLPAPLRLACSVDMLPAF
jgi:hypothetical protein